jgi:gamma-tubulin complex component 3
MVWLTRQSLCHFLHHELSEYHRLLAVLESQLESSEEAGSSTSLTLLRLGLWTEDMKLKLRMMSMIVDDAQGEFYFSSSHGPDDRHGKLYDTALTV